MPCVLLVEDDADQLRIRQTLLEHVGYDVRIASGAEEAATHAALADVVVMDLVPNCDELILGLPESTRLIVLSGREASEAVAKRSVYQLRKPCSTRVLMEKISSCCP
jgi:CheY-like chemotaxis protein